MHRRENGEHKGIAVLSAYIHITVIVNKYPLIAIACILNIGILRQIGVIASRSGRGIEHIAVFLSCLGTELVGAACVFLTRHFIPSVSVDSVALRITIGFPTVVASSETVM